ncbi:unnamed protein product [Paramecium primaurelia]|uniref:PHR domain-containing protein n=1 Tax=Paramecium primaurelia TaxID=5886 RepID=A0A8S1M1C3_PARPR|nr:unnamed protein product [Paramecium primaurelia]
MDLKRYRYKQVSLKAYKTAEVIERRENLNKLYETCQNPIRKQVKILTSQNRYQLTYEQLNQRKRMLFVLDPKRNMTYGYQELVYMNLQLGLNNLYHLLSKYLKVPIKNVIYKDIFTIQLDKDFCNHQRKFYFNKAIKIEFDKTQTIALKPNQSCLSYYGANSKFETDEFEFSQLSFTQEFSDNSTSINQGVIQLFYYE